MKQVAILISFFILPFIVRSQEFQRTQISFITEAGDTICIYQKPNKENRDTTTISIVRINKGGKAILQTFCTPCSFPYELDTISFHGQIGLLIKYDPAVRYGNSFLYLFNRKQNKFKKVDGFWNLGMIDNLIINGKKFLYSYVSCGCADNCWKSIMFDIKQNHIDTLAYIGCDCENLIQKTGKSSKETTSNNCDSFNNDDKFEKIKNYWIEKIKIGL